MFCDDIYVVASFSCENAPVTLPRRLAKVAKVAKVAYEGY